MSWNPNQGQDPNQQNPYGAYTPPPQGNPNSGQPYGQPSSYGQQGNYGQPGNYGQQPYGQPGGYQQGSGQQPYGGYQQPYGAPPIGTASPLGPSSLGMDPKVAAGISYLTGIVGLIFFIMEKQNRFVRFHALQAILLSVSIVVIYIALVIVGIISAFIDQSGTLPGLIFGLGGFVVWGVAIVGWLIGMINAFQGKYFKLPFVGNLADKWSGRGIASM